MLRKATLSALSVAAFALLAPGIAVADELVGVYQQILANPISSELNLQYAMIAEGRGEYRKALAAYERILVNDPRNDAAIRGIQRIRRIIEPPVTQKTMEVGARFETNPLRAEGGSDGDFVGYGSFRIRDERPLGGYRWRTIFGAYGEVYGSNSQLNYGNINGETGPLVDLPGTMVTFRPLVGGGAAYFDGRFYYWDVNVGAGLEGYLQGAHQWARLRAGYRQYDPSFTSDAGFYADFSGRFTLKNVIQDQDAFSVSPLLRWSAIEGLPDSGGMDFAPGRYIEGGVTFEYAKVLSEQFTAAINLRLRDKLYADAGLGARNDTMLSPGVSLIATNALGVQTDLRFDYRYEQNWSNQSGHNWQNHIFKVGFVARR